MHNNEKWLTYLANEQKHTRPFFIIMHDEKVNLESNLLI